jgi:hypothetical protein
MLCKETRLWHQLSKQAVHEQDPAKLKIIFDEINRLLEGKQTRPHPAKLPRANSQPATLRGTRS